jgi:hypothetical protein
LEENAPLPALEVLGESERGLEAKARAGERPSGPESSLLVGRLFMLTLTLLALVVLLGGLLLFLLLLASHPGLFSHFMLAGERLSA